MKHFGIISPPVPGHLHPMAALGRELVARGHRVSLLQVADLEAKAQAEGLDFEAIGLADHPRGSLAASLQALGRRKGFAALRFTIAAVARTSEMVCRDAPDVIRRAGIDALIVDQMEPAGGAVAEHLGLPFVTVANALALNRDPAVPPAFSPWRYSGTPWARWRNRIGYAIADRVTSPITRVVETYRRRWHLPPLPSPEASFSSLAQLSQLPRELDYPRAALPETFHYVGRSRLSGPMRFRSPGSVSTAGR